MAHPKPDAFDRLGLDPAIRLDKAAIQRAYLARAAAAHPDLLPGTQPDDAMDADTSAAALNDARSTLVSQEARANLLLSRLGGPAPSEDKSLPEGFLVTIMNTRLEIEQALEAADPQAIATWTDWAAQQRKDYFESAAERFESLASPPPEADLAAIRTTLNAWRYIERLIEQLDNASPAGTPGRTTRGSDARS